MHDRYITVSTARVILAHEHLYVTLHNLVYLWPRLAVDNLLKYTGYGNAAGLLVARGLLAGGRGETEYSEDEEDSDTEEYKSAKPL